MDPSRANIFLNSYLIRRRCTFSEADFIAVKDMFCVATGPNDSTNPRNMSKETRATQALGGMSVPTMILKAVLCQAQEELIPGLQSTDSVVLSHWTPKDGCWELASLTLGNSPGFPRFYPFCAGEPSWVLPALGRMRKELLNDWRQENSLRAWVPRDWPTYEPDLQSTDAASTHARRVEEAKPTLQLVEWSNEPPFTDKKGNQLHHHQCLQNRAARTQT